MYLPEIKNPEQITKDPTLKAIKPWWIVLIGAVILYLVPAQALLAQPILGAAIEWLASLIPSIARWSELSPFPANTKLFAVFVWVMIPVQVYRLISSEEVRHYFFVNKRQSLDSGSVRKRILAAALMATLMLLLLCAFVLLPMNFALVDTPPCRVCVNSVRWAQLLIGCIYSLTTAGLIAFFSLTIYLVVTRNNQGNKNV